MCAGRERAGVGSQAANTGLRSILQPAGSAADTSGGCSTRMTLDDEQPVRLSWGPVASLVVILGKAEHTTRKQGRHEAYQSAERTRLRLPTIFNYAW